MRNKSGEDIFLCPSGFKGVGRPFTEPTWMCTTGQHPRNYSSPSESTPPHNHMPVALLTAGAGCPRTRSTAGAIDADETEDDDEEGKSSPTTSGGTQLRSQLYERRKR